MNMNCHKVKELIPDYLEEILPSETRDQISQHLEHCAHCRNECLEDKALLASLEDLPKVDTEFRDRFQGALTAYKRGLMEGENLSKEKPLFNFPKFLNRNTFILANAAILMLVFYAGLKLGDNPNSQSTPMMTDIGQPRINKLEQEVAELRQITVFSLLKQPSASDRLLGVERLMNLDLSKKEAINALYDRLYLDNNINVQLAALDALASFTDDPEVRAKLIRYLEKPNSPLLRIELIKLLVRIGDERTLPVLEKISRDREADPTLKELAQWSSQYLKEENYHDI